MRLSEEERAQYAAAANTAYINNKLKLLEKAMRVVMSAGISEEIAAQVTKAASDFFGAEKARLFSEQPYPGAGEWDLLDSIELPACGAKAVDKARELGITSAEVLGLIQELGQRAADFCFGVESQYVDRD